MSETSRERRKKAPPSQETIPAKAVDIDSVLREIAGAEASGEEPRIVLTREAARAFVEIAGQAGMWREACKRLSEDIATLHERGNSEAALAAMKCLIEKLLPELDLFERAFANIDNWTDRDIIDGLVLAFERMAKVFGELGLKRIEAAGKPFDVNFHNAVGTAESDGDPNIVAEEIKAGWMFKGEVLRPSDVVVTVRPRG
jgi:molecular chaperone GrpE